MLFVIALTSLFVLLAISMNNRCWHNTSCVHTFCGLCTNTGIHRSSTGMVFALVTQNIQTPWTLSLSLSQLSFPKRVCLWPGGGLQQRKALNIHDKRTPSLHISTAKYPLKSIIFRWNLSTENYITRPFDPGACSAFFFMWKLDLVDSLATAATQRLASTGDG